MAKNQSAVPSCGVFLNSRLTHQSPATKTSVYIILDIIAACPPNIHATMSKLNIPIVPQLTAPIITSNSAILSIKTYQLLSNIFWRQRLKNMH